MAEDLNGLVRAGVVDSWSSELHGPKLTMYQIALRDGSRWSMRPSEVTAMLAVYTAMTA